jgi:hypothetical protein
MSARPRHLAQSGLSRLLKRTSPEVLNGQSASLNRKRRQSRFGFSRESIASKEPGTALKARGGVLHNS